MNPGPQALHLLLQSQLLSLQGLDPVSIRGGPGQFVLDGAFEGLMTHSEFANASFDGHDHKAPVLTTPEVVTQILMAVPLYLLYEITVWIAWYWDRQERKRVERES